MLERQEKKQLEEIRRELSLIGAKEGNFIKVELLFYQAIDVARASSDEGGNALLTALKRIQSNQYQQTSAPQKKSVQREKVIQRFITSFKAALSAAIKQ